MGESNAHLPWGALELMTEPPIPDPVSVEESLILKAIDALGLSVEALKRANHSGEEEAAFLKRKLTGNRLSAIFFKYIMSGSPADFSENCIEQLRSRSLNNSIRSLRNAAFLKRLSDVLGKDEIPFIVLKGELLGRELYGDFGIRHSGDIDIWVSENDLQRVHSFLVEDGFALEGDYFDRSDNYRHVYRRFLPHFSYSREDGVLVEVHWRLFNTPSFCSFSFEEAVRSGQTVSIKGSDLTLLEPIDNFLYLMAHASNHFYVRMFWLLDLAIYLDRNQGILNEELLSKARAYGIERALAYSFQLLNHYLDVPIPSFMEGVMVRHQAGIQVCRMVTDDAYADSRVLGSGLRVHEQTAFRLLKLEWSLSERWNYKAQLLFRSCLNGEDFKRVSLPPSLYFLYPMLRLPFWLQRHVLR